MNSHDKERHFLYLTDLVWGELKLRAFAEKKSASAVIASLLEYFLDDSVDDLPVGRYQDRIPPESLDQRETRTIFISGELWRRATENRDEEKDYSISGVVEYLLRQYLGLPQIGEDVDLSVDEDELGEGETDSSNTLNTGSVTFDLGDDPVDLDLSSE